MGRSYRWHSSHRARYASGRRSGSGNRQLTGTHPAAPSGPRGGHEPWRGRTRRRPGRCRGETTPRLRPPTAHTCRSGSASTWRSPPVTLVTEDATGQSHDHGVFAAHVELRTPRRDDLGRCLGAAVVRALPNHDDHHQRHEPIRSWSSSPHRRSRPNTACPRSRTGTRHTPGSGTKTPYRSHRTGPVHHQHEARSL